MNGVTVNPDENIFEVLGHKKEEASNLLIRSQLMGEVKQYIRDNGMTLRSCSSLLRDQPSPHQRSDAGPHRQIHHRLPGEPGGEDGQTGSGFCGKGSG